MRPTNASRQPATAGVLNEPRDDHDTLVVLLHGAFEPRPMAARRLTDVKRVAMATFDKPDLLAPALPSYLFSLADPMRMAWAVAEMIDERYAAHEARGHPLKKVVLVGFSFGAILARMVYVLACGESPDRRWIVRDQDGEARSVFCPERISPIPARPWASCVDRVILIAGVSRGWTIDFRVQGLAAAALFHTLEAIDFAVHGLASVTRKILRRPNGPTFAMSIRRGGRFVSELRWQWLQMRREDLQTREGKSIGKVMTIQLLGTKDDVVAPDDNVDLITGKDFIYLELPDCGHPDAVQMELPENPPAEISLELKDLAQRFPAGQARALILRDVLRQSEKHLRDYSVQPQEDEILSVALSASESVQHGALAGDAQTSLPPVSDVAFVIHGIRDQGFWTQKVAWRIQRLARERQRRFASVTRSYGYFPMWPFLFPWERRGKVEWLVDQYVEACAVHPKAAFHYVGHSNGTYLLASALQEYGFVRFGHVVFAGSVVRHEYPWKTMIANRQVTGVLNYVATGDWVVALFPGLFEFIRIQQLGNGGHNGFRDLERVASTEDSFERNPCLEIAYTAGAHGSAVVENNWDEIASAIVDGKPRKDAKLCVTDRSFWDRCLVAVSKVPWAVWLAIIGILYSLACLIVWAKPWTPAAGWAAWVAELRALRWQAFARLGGLFALWRTVRFVVLRL